jgi:quercetin dioxygenase-like cupin family protein
MSCKIAYVLTLSFGARNPAPVECALDEVLRLNPYRVILVHDVKGPGGACARAAVASQSGAYAVAGLKLEIYAVDQEETAHRWRAGWIHAFEDPEVEAAFVFATDFDKPPSDSAREGWRKMAEAASADALVLGDYQPKPASFKDDFYQLVARPAVEAIFAREGAALVELGLRQFRTEFFVMGRAVLERLRHDSIPSTMDPTTDMALTCLRSTDLALRLLDLGSFEDQADTRDPLGELYQTTRYVFERVINLIRLKRSAGLDRAGQIRLYEELLPVIDRAVEVGRYAARRNLERLHENPKIAAYLPAAPWDECWVAAPFEGFSYLLDNPGNSLAKTAEGIPYIDCDTSAAAERDLALYRKLVAAVRTLEPHLRKFSFCPLSYDCMHVTLWDGINRANASSLTADRREEYAACVRGLPASAAGPAPSILPPPVITMDGRWSVKFKFKGLHIWEEAAALVALLEPADEKSQESIALLERHCEVLDEHYATFGKPRNRRWVQHVSVGYFWTSAAAAAAKRHLPEWNEAVSAALDEETIQFSSASLYSFQDMKTFLRHPIPALLVSVPAIKAALAEGSGFLGKRGDQKVAITYQYPSREQLGSVRWQPLARSGNTHYCVTPLHFDQAVFTHAARQKRHFHERALEVYRVLEGTMAIMVGGEKHSITAGEGIVVPQYAVHEVVPESPFIAEVIVANIAGPVDGFNSEGWTVPGRAAAPAMHLRPCGVELGADGAAEIFRSSAGVGVTVFDERWKDEAALHTHRSTQIFLVLAGSMTLQVNGESYEMDAGDRITVFPQAVHSVLAGGPYRAEVVALDC